MTTLTKGKTLKEFTTAVEAVEREDAELAKIATLVETKIAALTEAGIEVTEEHRAEAQREAEAEVDAGDYTEFSLDGRIMRAYPPDDGQLAFMIASMGRGQTADQRFAAIINVMMGCLRENDADYLESFLLERNHMKKKSKTKVLEGIFEWLAEEWFGRPTQQP